MADKNKLLGHRSSASLRPRGDEICNDRIANFALDHGIVYGSIVLNLKLLAAGFCVRTPFYADDL
jgi:hypothetical protein